MKSIDAKFCTPIRDDPQPPVSASITQGGKVQNAQRQSVYLTQVCVPYLSVHLIPTTTTHQNQLRREAPDSSFLDVFELENNHI